MGVDLTGGAADPSLVIDLSASLESPGVAGTETNIEERKPRTNGSAFGHFAYGNSKGKDPLPADEFSSLVDGGSKPQFVPQRHRQRLGSLRNSILQRASLNKLSSGDSPAGPRKRQRFGSAFSDDDLDDSLDIPLDKRPLSRLVKRPAQVSESEEEEVVLVPAPEPSMRKKIEQNRTYGPKMADLEMVGEVLKEDAVDELLEQCSHISDKLRNALGNSKGTGSYEALEGDSRMATPELLAAACGPAARYIKSYQLIGINFLLLLAREGVEGSILADEMGLGKTAQTICFLGCLRQLYNDKGPHLVICPASLLENWERELQRWCPDMEVVSYYGANRSETRYNLSLTRDALASGNATAKIGQQQGSDGESQEDEDSDSEAESSPSESDFEEAEQGKKARRETHKAAGPREAGKDAPFDIMLTCYTLFERDSTEQKYDRKFLRSWKWSHLILDEAHAVKNSSAMRTVRLNKIAEQCNRRVMLTGTPLQNDLEELQNLLRFLMPKLFTAEEAEEIANVQGEEEINKLAERMQNLLRPFVLRRLKTEVANQLAPKQHKLHRLAMTDEQARLYAKAVANLRKDLDPSSEGNSGKDAEGKLASAGKVIKKLGQRKMGNAFVALRKIALHPLLARSIYTDSQIAEMAKMALRRDIFGGQATEAKVLAELQGYSDFDLHALARSNGGAFAKFLLEDSRLFGSAKCCFLAKLLPELKEAGSRPLIFSQWTMMLDILEWLLQCLKLPFVRLDGSTAVTDRLTIVDMFNNKENGVFAFLLSTRAGGQGLNLTGADTVILHDVDFNPQIDRQAEDRCHRLGQMRPVTVIRLVTQGSVDEGIHALAERKLRLDAAVLDGITASSKQTKAADNLAMSELLQNLIAGDASGKPVDGENKMITDNAEEVTVVEPPKALQLSPQAGSGAKDPPQNKPEALSGKGSGAAGPHTSPRAVDSLQSTDDDVIVLSPVSPTKANSRSQSRPKSIMKSKASSDKSTHNSEAENNKMSP